MSNEELCSECIISNIIDQNYINKKIESGETTCQFKHNVYASEVATILEGDKTLPDGYNFYYIVVNTLKGREDINGVRHIEQSMRKYKYTKIFITREIIATNIHYNILVCMSKESYKELLKKNRINFQFIKPNIQLANVCDLKRIMVYMTKELQVRNYDKNDHYVYIKEGSRSSP